MNRNELNELSGRIIGLAIKVHKNLGSGFIEKIYEKALIAEFEKNNINYAKQKSINVLYSDIEIEGQRIDLLVEDEIILELKAVTFINKLFQSQLLSYLKAVDKRLGLILNFSKKKLEIKRIVNNF